LRRRARIPGSRRTHQPDGRATQLRAPPPRHVATRRLTDQSSRHHSTRTRAAAEAATKRLLLAFLCSAPTVKQSSSAPHVQQSRSAPTVQQSRSAPTVQQSRSAPVVLQTKGRGGGSLVAAVHSRGGVSSQSCEADIRRAEWRCRLDAWTTSFRQIATSGLHASWPTSVNVSSRRARAFRIPSWQGWRVRRSALVSATLLYCCVRPGCACRWSMTLAGRLLPNDESWQG
ncbi:MAG: hypothetical protein QOH29_2662, partial [Actinomycetota bacterium]|nr:hypothetical protein [Actinomycetota bacterium]